MTTAEGDSAAGTAGVPRGITGGAGMAGTPGGAGEQAQFQTHVQVAVRVPAAVGAAAEQSPPQFQIQWTSTCAPPPGAGALGTGDIAG
jgi:hypothetical protein